VPLLRERGVETTTVDLPSMDANAGRGDDVEVVRAALDGLGRPAILVGHSYGGRVISEAAADHPRVKRLVYLTALVPDVGETLADLFGLVPNPDLFGVMKQTDDGRSMLDPGTSGAVFYNDCDAETVAWAMERMRSMRLEAGTPAATAAWRGLPSTYIVCTQDRAILPELQRRMAARTSEVIEIEASHSPFASQPGVVAAIIERLARA
jgi:pimeloyl-ACP methyl ester carboxylesterase